MSTKELAEQAGARFFNTLGAWMLGDEELERFAELIRADEREQISHTYLKLTLDAVLREREACAKLCEGYQFDYAKAIRQRGEK